MGMLLAGVFYPIPKKGLGLDHGVGHPTAASGPRHSTAALQAKRV